MTAPIYKFLNLEMSFKTLGACEWQVLGYLMTPDNLGNMTDKDMEGDGSSLFQGELLSWHSAKKCDTQLLRSESE